ncbi:hypothetical protein C7U61_07720 [Rhizobium sp. JAB6]|nr:hypothetical protein C7U61_07720 [Rhizobium sp. JAB6]
MPNFRRRRNDADNLRLSIVAYKLRRNILPAKKRLWNRDTTAENDPVILRIGETPMEMKVMY